MSFRSIVALTSGTGGDVEALLTAARLARAFDGRLKVVPVLPDPAADLAYLGAALGAPISGDVVAAIVAAQRDVRARVEHDARRAAEGAGLPYGAFGSPGVIVEHQALAPWLAFENALPLTDLLVVDAAATLKGIVGSSFATALLGARTAALLARAAAPAIIGGVVAIAWDGSAEAGHAVRAALPLLHRASRLVVLQCPSGLDVHDRDAAARSEVLEYLRLHGMTASFVEVDGRPEGPALLDTARRQDAALLVAGAWGHSRLREAILGGATRSFLHAPDGPHLLLHH
jgi:nucleotide-binding universal stress UspA family protein